MCIVLQPQKVNFLVWADSVSLAATWEIAFAFSSSRYLDVSVPWVCLIYPMYSGKCTVPLRTVGCPIRKSSDQSLLTTPQIGRASCRERVEISVGSEFWKAKLLI